MFSSSQIVLVAPLLGPYNYCHRHNIYTCIVRTWRACFVQIMSRSFICVEILNVNAQLIGTVLSALEKYLSLPFSLVRQCQMQRYIFKSEEL